MKLTRNVFIASLSLTLLSCGGTKSGGGQPGATATTEQDAGDLAHIGTVSWLFQGYSYPFTADNGQDAVTYTFGSVKLRAIPVVDGYALSEEQKALPAALFSKRYLLFQPQEGQADVTQSLEESDRKLAETFCNEVQVAVPEGAKLSNEEFVVSWRSHFSSADRNNLGLLLLDKNLKFRCGITFGLSYGNAADTHFMNVSLDPSPVIEPTKVHPADNYSGTSQYEIAGDESIMLAEVRSHSLADFDASWQKIELEDASPYTLSTVTALNAASFASLPDPTFDGTSCDLRLTDTLKAMNPDAEQTITYELPDLQSRSFEVKEAGFAAVAGTTTPETCKVLPFKVESEHSFSYQLSCAQLRDIQDAGKCGVLLKIVNPDDSSNDLALKVTLDKQKASTLDLGKRKNAYPLVPKASGNPIRSKSITLSLFSDQQLNELAIGFDFWMNIANDSYTSFFPVINEIIYETSSPDCDGAGAFAEVPGTKIWWCPGGGLSGDSLSEEKTSFYLVYRAVTALHESLHANGRHHDIEAESLDNAPCSSTKGTAYSAVIAVNTYTCTEDYCFGFKDLAKEEFTLELNYSLKNDARRFQGQCDVWAKKLGVSF